MTNAKTAFATAEIDNRNKIGNGEDFKIMKPNERLFGIFPHRLVLQ
jgi:hypothetical protein